MLNAIDLVNEAWNAGTTPPPSLSVWEWADDNRYLSSSVTSQPGNWRTDRVPYTRGIMDSLSPNSAAREIWLKKGSQIAGTESGLNWVGFTVAQAPASMMIVLPDQGTAKEWSVQRLSQLTEDTKALHGLIRDSKLRDSGNTAFSKKFPGGHLKITWSSSAKKLRSTPAANVLADEVDGFTGDVKGEGDPIALLKRRFTNYPRGKLFGISTPTLRHLSRIDREFLKGDQRYYFIPCPHCGHFQRLAFERLKWETGEPQGAQMQCSACEAMIPERFKTQMLAAGRWVATGSRPELAGIGFAAAALPMMAPIFREMEVERVVSYHLSALYSPLGWYSWGQLAADWEAADKPELLKVFVNTVLGETWADKGEVPDPEKIWMQREDFELGIVPAGGLVLTASVDVQGDRLEFSLEAWGRNRQRWGIYYEVIKGDPATDAPWKRLGELLEKNWPHVSGAVMPINAMGIDTGYKPKRVYEFCRRHPQPLYGPAGAKIVHARTVVPLKGGGSATKIIENVSTVDAARQRAGLRIVTVGTAVLKDDLYFSLRLPKPEDGEEFPAGYCHYAYPEKEYYQGLCAETRVSRNGKVEWVKDPRFRNEPMDLAVYNAAMASLVGVDRFKDSKWLALEEKLQLSADIETFLAPPPPAEVSGVQTSVKFPRPAAAPRPAPRPIASDDPYLS